jgi:transcriptional regulator with PAS, ATPase and Fis domain
LEHGQPTTILGESAPIRELRLLVERVACTPMSVLIQGETGTGKEVVAQTIHRLSQRRDGPCVAVNCAAVPENLLESELFGHARGAFTGAGAPRQGLIQRAHGGTLFLDEVGDMPHAIQPRLLRVLQERRVRPVGSDEEVPVDIRVVAATHFDLEDAVADGNFREDLLYRLNVVRLDVPPLRARGDDVLILAHDHLGVLSQRLSKPNPALSSAFAQRLLDYDWPGNVRELRNCMERALAMSEGPELIVGDLPRRIANYRRPPRRLLTLEDPEELVPLEEVEREYVLRVLELVRGNKARAARILGVSRKTLYRKIQHYTEDSGRLKILRDPDDSGRLPIRRDPEAS